MASSHYQHPRSNGDGQVDSINPAFLQLNPEDSVDNVQDNKQPIDQYTLSSNDSKRFGEPQPRYSSAENFQGSGGFGSQTYAGGSSQSYSGPESQYLWTGSYSGPNPSTMSTSGLTENQDTEAQRTMGSGLALQTSEDMPPPMIRQQSSLSPSHNSPLDQSGSPHSHRPSSLSLDPSSAQFPAHRRTLSGQSSLQIGQPYISTDWTNQLGPEFQGHRRHSSTHSNISSAVSSPFVDAMNQLETLSQGASPLIAPLPEDPSMSNMNFGDVTLMDSTSQYGGTWQGSLIGDAGYQRPPLPNHQALSYESALLQRQPSGASNDPSRSRNRSSTTQLPIPEIQVDLAANQPVATNSANVTNGLLPSPMQERGRVRSRSDPYLGLTVGAFVPRATSATNSPSGLHARSPSHGRSVSPHEHILGQIKPSPISRKRAVSASSLPVTAETARSQILGLATGESGMGRRAQIHPAKFKCQECGSAFTRMYNLHSHMRTHTNERPFKCSVCGKAFARQHDRRRHENLHTGNRKFKCEVTLHSGQKVGCKRKFARADALGRHFKSEAGKKCIQPLLDEDRQERMMMLAEQHKDYSLEQLAGMVPEPTFGQDGIPDLFRMRMPELSPLPSPRSGQHSSYSSENEGDFDGEFGASHSRQTSGSAIGSDMDMSGSQVQNPWQNENWLAGSQPAHQSNAGNEHLGQGFSFNAPMPERAANQYFAHHMGDLAGVAPADLGGGDFVAGIQDPPPVLPSQTSMESTGADPDFLPDLSNPRRQPW